MQKLKPILLAEDNANDIELTLAVFREHNLANHIDVVCNGAEAIDYLLYRGAYANRPKEKPAVILLDIKMPKISGIEALKEIKQNPKLKDISVVMLTSSNLETDIVESYNLGVNAYVVKPVDFSEFVKAIKTIGFFWSLLNKTP